MLLRAEDFEQEQAGSDADGGVGDIEARPEVCFVVELEEIHDVQERRSKRMTRATMVRRRERASRLRGAGVSKWDMWFIVEPS